MTNPAPEMVTLQSGVTMTREAYDLLGYPPPMPTPSREPGDMVPITRAALVDLLTTAATLGRDMTSASTRGDVTAALAAYGLAVESPRLDVAVANAITATSAL